MLVKLFQGDPHRSNKLGAIVALGLAGIWIVYDYLSEKKGPQDKAPGSKQNSSGIPAVTEPNENDKRNSGPTDAKHPVIESNGIDLVTTLGTDVSIPTIELNQIDHVAMPGSDMVAPMDPSPPVAEDASLNATPLPQVKKKKKRKKKNKNTVTDEENVSGPPDAKTHAMESYGIDLVTNPGANVNILTNELNEIDHVAMLRSDMVASIDPPPTVSEMPFSNQTDHDAILEPAPLSPNSLLKESKGDKPLHNSYVMLEEPEIEPRKVVAIQLNTPDLFFDGQDRGLVLVPSLLDVFPSDMTFMDLPTASSLIVIETIGESYGSALNPLPFV